VLEGDAVPGAIRPRRSCRGYRRGCAGRARLGRVLRRFRHGIVLAPRYTPARPFITRRKRAAISSRKWWRPPSTRFFPPRPRRSRLGRPGEDPGVEDRVAGLARKRRVVSVERDEVGDAPGDRCPATARRAPGRRRPRPRRTARGRSTAGRGQHVAGAVARRCEYSSWRNSSATPISTLESEPTPKRPPAQETGAGRCRRRDWPR
jgi:hypothetical protein